MQNITMKGIALSLTMIVEKIEYALEVHHIKIEEDHYLKRIIEDLKYIAHEAAKEDANSCEDETHDEMNNEV
jgi:hypothetical protein